MKQDVTETLIFEFVDENHNMFKETCVNLRLMVVANKE